MAARFGFDAGLVATASWRYTTMKHERLIETFNTHRMSAAVVQAVATARDMELEEVMQAVRRAANQPQQIPQHLIVYGERGSGKSFLMRMVEIAIERLVQEENLPVVAALLPEEQYNIRTAPQLLLAIAAKVRGAGWQDSAFTLDFRPLQEAWEAAVSELEAALDQRFGQGFGIVVAMIENFDTLTRNLFGSSNATQKKTASTRAIEQSSAEQLLRKLMNTKGSRLMLVAAATGTVDQDYERPLFQAFKTVDLRIWTSDDCIAYFNRRRDLEQQAHLSLPEEARARAIAEFIGGNPRLAQLLGEVLATSDAHGIAATLDALSDHLADYYRRRLDDLPPQAAALLDALIRKGEPCTQTELAARVGANSQAQIADAFSYLLSSRLLVAGADKRGAGRLYRLQDRLFVHFYRRRYGEPENAQGLAPIAELLESFFTRNEREQQARRHLEAGEWANARLFVINNPMAKLPSDGFCPYRDEATIGMPSELFQLAGLNADEAIRAQTELKAHPDLAVKYWHDKANGAGSALSRAASWLLEANALCRCLMDSQAEEVLVKALHLSEANGDSDAQILALSEMATFYVHRLKDQDKALGLAAKAGELAGQAQNNCVRAKALHCKAWSVSTAEMGGGLEAIGILDAAYGLASDRGLQVHILLLKSQVLDKLQRYGEALAVLIQVVDLALITGLVYIRIEALASMGVALFNQKDYEKSEAVCNQALQLAVDISDQRSQCRLLCLQAGNLRELKRLDEACDIARKAAKLAKTLGDLEAQGVALLIVGFVLICHGKFKEANSELEQAESLAKKVGKVHLQLKAIIDRAWCLALDNQYEPAIKLAQMAIDTAIQTMAHADQHADALRLTAWCLGKLGRTDEALGTFVAAFDMAKVAGQKQLLIAILEDQFDSLGWQALALARVTIAELLNTAFINDLWAARQIFFESAMLEQAADVVDVFATCLVDVNSDDKAQLLQALLDEVQGAVAYNDCWEAFTACLLQHPQALSLLTAWQGFEGVGWVWGWQVKNQGRAETYALVVRQLSAIERLIEILPVEKALNHYLGELVNGLVNSCDDAGFLQDFAELLEGRFDGQTVSAEVQRLRAFAQVHAAKDKEQVLQRLDPDLALAIRLILGLPEPDDVQMKGRKKGR
ncbi:hypothetical protein KFZ76_12780 [Methylovulum psychrotolerans]|nr:hypothetical protein [Methylovulum psychrotolerans]MBT9098575.1 hypothetical protein [Methylovulum psychrotolerans]